jgi:FKBP-type peptidyl-prolyl cis-trans isomerase
VFDETKGTDVAIFPLSSLIEGWKRGIPLLGEGGKIRLFIPPSLGYGPGGWLNPNTGLYNIPPNAVLIFEIKLITVTG